MRGEDFGEGGVHGGADGGAKVFDGCEAAKYWGTGRVGVGELGGIGVIRGGGREHGGDFAEFGVCADEGGFVAFGGVGFGAG